MVNDRSARSHSEDADVERRALTESETSDLIGSETYESIIRFEAEIG